jgi:hypothetical protein
MAGIPAYTTEAEATAVIISQCGDPNAKLENLIDKIADAHDMQRLPSTAWAHVGDIVLFESASGQAVGVVGFKGSHAHIVGTSGLHYVPLSACKCAWALDRGKDYVVHPSFVGTHYQVIKGDNHE